MLQVGDRLPAPVAGGFVEVVCVVGEGGQGAVYEVAEVGTGQRRALKWYHPAAAAPEQRNAIEMLVERGAPSSAFLWPQAVVSAAASAEFGYLMPLRPPHYVGLADLLAGRAELSFSGVVTVGLELAHSFLLLHAQGLCYRDISFGNVFVDPSTGGVLICDCDNVGVDGESASMVLGTRRFMAPEIVRGEAGPSRQTDLFSLAVLLFYLLIVGHPLVGRRELDLPAHDAHRSEQYLFGEAPLFVFHEQDRSNAPVPELHGPVADNWRLYPGEIRALFNQTFTVGLSGTGSGRVQESVWRRALMRLRDSIGQCSSCGAENFFHPTSSRARCWSCSRMLTEPLVLAFDHTAVVLKEDRLVHGHHLRQDYDISSVVGVVARHPDDPARWGLRNVSAVPWTVTLPDREPVTVPPGRTVGLVPGATYDFGRRAAVLRHGFADTGRREPAAVERAGPSRPADSPRGRPS